jgi:hypothetical protein
LTPGATTLEVRSLAFDAVTKQTLTGAWTPLEFTYVAPTIAPPAVASLALADDTGASNTDKITTDPTVSGTATGVNTGAALVIQLDTNGDGTPDATTTADAGGIFTWTPQNLSAGQVTIAARAVDDDANGNAIYGAWASLPFTLQAAAPAAATVVSALSLAVNVGPSSDALLSADGAITG